MPCAAADIFIPYQKKTEKMPRYLLFISLFIAIQGAKAQTDVFTNDEEITNSLKDHLLNAYEKKDFVSLEKLRTQLVTVTPTKVEPLQKNSSFVSNTEVYAQGKKSTLILGKLFDTQSNGRNYVYTATATIITSDGICITNHHVFEKMAEGYSEKMIGVMDVEGNFYKISEGLASNENDDLAVFKIDTNGKKLQGFNLGELPEIGTNVHVIGHPKNKYYTYTTGVVSRLYYYAAEQSNRISITADFAVGSSGGPILNDNGQLIGMVAVTEAVPSARAVQMVIKEIIPVSSIKNLLNKVNTQ